MPSTMLLSTDEAREYRAKLIESTGRQEDELRLLAEEYLMTPAERSVWEAVLSLDYLIGDD